MRKDSESTIVAPPPLTFECLSQTGTTNATPKPLMREAIPRLGVLKRSGKNFIYFSQQIFSSHQFFEMGALGKEPRARFARAGFPILRGVISPLRVKFGRNLKGVA